MTPQSLLLGLGAGLISAIVFASATTGPAVTRILFFLLTPFPLYLAGLGLGFIPALVGALSATLAILALSSPNIAAIFAANVAVPSVILTRLAMLSRGEGDDRIWYPPGRLIAVAALLAASSAAAVLIATGADTATLMETLKPAIADVIKSMMQNAPEGKGLSDEEIQNIAAGIVPLIPGFLAILTMLTSLVSLWLAGRVTLASQRLARPWPNLNLIELPPGSALALLAGTVLSFAGGTLGPLAGCFAGAFYFAFALLGLAVIHYVTHGSPWRNFILSATYVALILFAQYLLLILALIGLAESYFHYRATSDRAPPTGHRP